VFQDNVDKPVSECRTILASAAGRDDGIGDGADWNSSRLQSSSQITTRIPALGLFTGWTPFLLPNCYNNSGVMDFG